MMKTRIMVMISIQFLSSVQTASAAAWLVSKGLVRLSSRRQQQQAATRLFSSNRLLESKSLQNTYGVLRHGRSLANEAKLISSHPHVATIQHGLSTIGIEQAQTAGKDIVQFYKTQQQQQQQLDHPTPSYNGIAILTSDYLRAKETAWIVAEAVSAARLPLYTNTVVMEPRLRERWFGEWDGGPDAHYPDVWKEDAMNADHTVRGVESVHAVMNRTTEAVLEWDRTLSNHLIVLVAHGDVLQITQTAFAKLDGTKHRTIDHLETATFRRLDLLLE